MLSIFPRCSSMFSCQSRLFCLQFDQGASHPSLPFSDSWLQFLSSHSELDWCLCFRIFCPNIFFGIFKEVRSFNRAYCEPKSLKQAPIRYRWALISTLSEMLLFRSTRFVVLRKGDANARSPSALLSYRVKKIGWKESDNFRGLGTELSKTILVTLRRSNRVILIGSKVFSSKCLFAWSSESILKRGMEKRIPSKIMGSSWSSRSLRKLVKPIAEPYERSRGWGET